MLSDNGIETQFAVAEFIVTMGMFLIMFGEHLVMALQHHHGEMDASFNSHSSEGQGDRDERQRLIDWQHSGHEDHGHPHHHKHQDNEKGMFFYFGIHSSPKEVHIDLPQFSR